MEYLYQQQPLPTNAKGVTVKLTAIDPNGNLQNIGTATTDLMGNFGIAWVPPVEGTYQIKATFEGTESYWPSYNTAYMVVDPAPAAQPTSTPTATVTPPQPTPTPSVSPSVVPEPESPAPSMDVYVIAAVVAIVVVVVAVAAVFLRKRK
jgi:hypothetical protein